MDNAALRESPWAVAMAARGVLFGVVLMNMILMRQARSRGAPLPRLYTCGVTFAPEPNEGVYEDFADCLTVLRRGWGDCDDLVAYRVAELRESGEDPKASLKIYWREVPDLVIVKEMIEDGHQPTIHKHLKKDLTEWYVRSEGRLYKLPTNRVYHGQVRRGNKKDKHGKGLVEDPSRLLGM